MSSFMKVLIRYMSACSVGLYCYVVGSVGAFMIISFCLHKISENGIEVFSPDVAKVVTILFGQAFGGLPFGFLGANWIAKKLFK